MHRRETPLFLRRCSEKPGGCEAGEGASALDVKRGRVRQGACRERRGTENYGSRKTKKTSAFEGRRGGRRVTRRTTQFLATGVLERNREESEGGPPSRTSTWRLPFWCAPLPLRLRQDASQPWRFRGSSSSAWSPGHRAWRCMSVWPTGPPVPSSAWEAKSTRCRWSSRETPATCEYKCDSGHRVTPNAAARERWTIGLTGEPIPSAHDKNRWELFYSDKLNVLFYWIFVCFREWLRVLLAFHSFKMWGYQEGNNFTHTHTHTHTHIHTPADTDRHTH